MAVWQIDIQKNLGTEYWTNVYHCDVASQDAARTVGDAIVDAERDLHMQNVTFTSFRVRPFPSLGAQGTVYAVGLQGRGAIAEYLPLFNSVNVIFTVASGRPSRKYLRLPIPEVAQGSGQISGTYLTDWNTKYSDVLLALAGLCDSDGNPFLAIALVPTVGMRQLRRGSRRRVLPII